MKIAKNLFILCMGLIICLVILVGCSGPKGFIEDDRDSYPFKYLADGDHEYPDIRTQFPEFEPDLVPGKFRRYWFNYIDGKYFLIEPSWPTTGTTSIYKQAEIHEKIGDFEDVRKKYKRMGVIFKKPFLYEDYLYYYFYMIDTRRFGLSDWIWYDKRYTRYEFYKFDLRTGRNENINLTEFVEALHLVDSRWEINPDYKGEK